MFFIILSLVCSLMSSPTVAITPAKLDTMEPIVQKRIIQVVVPQKLAPVERPKQKTKVSRSRKVTERLTQSDAWSMVSKCETGLRNVTNPSGKYRGYFQFSLTSWHDIGMSGDPLKHSYYEQKLGAIKLYNKYGAGAWPICGKYLRK